MYLYLTYIYIHATYWKKCNKFIKQLYLIKSIFVVVMKGQKLMCKLCNDNQGFGCGGDFNGYQGVK